MFGVVRVKLVGMVVQISFSGNSRVSFLMTSIPFVVGVTLHC